MVGQTADTWSRDQLTKPKPLSKWQGQIGAEGAEMKQAKFGHQFKTIATTNLR